MIYENFAGAEAIVVQIRHLEEFLSNLTRSDVEVHLFNGRVNKVRFNAIGTWETCEHPLRKHAAEFIHKLIEETEFKIRQLKRDLGKL